jgi:hypothetical protein
MITIIWLGSTVMWMLLGSTLVFRTGDMGDGLRKEVHALWGEPMIQLPPRATLAPVSEGPTSSGGQKAVDAESVPLESSRIRAKIDLEHRQKGLLWFPTYSVNFDATYSFMNRTEEVRTLNFVMPLQSSNALYDGLRIETEQGALIPMTFEGASASWNARFDPGETKKFRIAYRSRGTDTWTYALAADTYQLKNFGLSLDTNFDEVDFSPDSLSPNRHHVNEEGWHGSWNFKTLVSSASIGVRLPERVNPGPLASRITFFAPVGLLFFFFVVTVLSETRQRTVRPVSYFFLAAGFFAFHLLFAYLVDHLPIWASFALASATSLALVYSYTRLAQGPAFSLRVVVPSQFIYLVLFSFSFFWQGFTGLAVTVGAIATLFVMMQIVGRRESASTEPIAAKSGCPTPYRCAQTRTQIPIITDDSEVAPRARGAQTHPPVALRESKS